MHMSQGTLHEHLSKPAGVIDYTEDGKCSKCGSCCTNQLPMTPQEARRIQSAIKTRKLKPTTRLPVFANPKTNVDATCPFLTSSCDGCTIYDIRPKICREFICNKPSGDVRKRFYEGKNANARICFLREDLFGVVTPFSVLIQSEVNADE